MATDITVGLPGLVQLIREPLPPNDEPPMPADGSVWPSLAWEERLRTRCRHLGLPRLLGRFTDDEYSYLAVEAPTGAMLWDAWDDPAYGMAEKFGWLIQLADLLKLALGARPSSQFARLGSWRSCKLRLLSPVQCLCP